ncbi:MAG: HD domain-containing protein [Thermoanaerobaculia bacterium]|nr:HD domain-containing protein [Thermoanaerobaculia bacterium]
MATPRIAVFEPDPRRAASIARSLERLRVPVAAAATTSDLAAMAAEAGTLVVALSGLGGRVAARVRMVRENPGTAASTILALVPPGPAGVSALKAGADEVLVWPAHESLARHRLRSVFAAARTRDEAKRTALPFAHILEAVEAREPHRIEHSARVGRLAAEMAKLAGLSTTEVERVRVGGSIHDFGTVAIPDGILYKREPLSDAEFAVMRSHPVIGFSLLKEVPALEPYLSFVLRHHERIDGSGYPDGLRGAELPLPVQLVSLADAYDAMTSSRPYRAVRGDRQTLLILEEEASRGLWDPAHIPLLASSIPVLEGTAPGI